MAAPSIVSRRDWGARTSVRPGPVAPSSRRYFVVHYPVMGNRDERQWCRDVEAMHVRQGWGAAPGYNYLVGMSGTIYEGCGRDVRGIHSPPRNTDGWGCCVLLPTTAQGVATAPLSEAAKTATRRLYDWLCSVAGRRLAMSWHGEHYATGCPGPVLTAWVKAGMPAQAPAPPKPQPPPQPQETQMIASAVSDSGNSLVWVVGPQRRTCWLTNQGQGQSTWSGGQAGKSIAGLRKFQDAPQGRTYRGITAFRGPGGMTWWLGTLDDGSTVCRTQGKGKTDWSQMSLFTPKP